jgi:methionyl-tRNA formyltransferase
LEEISSGPPGTLASEGAMLAAETGSARLRLTEVQPEGKSRMSGAEFIRGYGRELPGRLT